MLLAPQKSQLLIVDMQERLLPAVREGEAALARAAILVRAAKRLGVPVAATEQYPRGLGHTVTALAAVLEDAPVIAKLAFSGLAEKAVAAHLARWRSQGRSQLLLAGLEAHVCVLQTAIEAHGQGYDVYVAVDAIAARAQASLRVALERMAKEGIRLVTTEMAVFEWLERAGTDDFKALSALIR
jgi:nicotinamidase-related amidase